MTPTKAITVLLSGGRVRISGAVYTIHDGRLCVVAGGRLLRSDLKLNDFLHGSIELVEEESS